MQPVVVSTLVDQLILEEVRPPVEHGVLDSVNRGVPRILHNSEGMRAELLPYRGGYNPNCLVWNSRIALVWAVIKLRSDASGPGWVVGYPW